ncbi:putative cyclase [Fomitiporia mediterranea MF3/22]|uniref:putative cyclase n=1 Tax=Fomitiporia mediterranea (strain MF3/22) TaxID=694068 RepID=UPI0004408309|nr:putative cyclase [Fomitiporia mediterranea MF3/22]EJD08173.1 putative cyclase [Fomitiporia mediterranea MF3/22]
MRIYDLSHKLDSNTQIYPGDPSVCFHKHTTVQNDGFAVTGLSLGSHSGTHIDAPCHFFEDGISVDAIDISLLVGPAVVLDVLDRKPRERITWDHLIKVGANTLIQGHRIVLIRTDWPKHWKTPLYLDHPFLDREAARKLLDMGVRVLGVDTLNPDETFTEGEGSDFGVHETILGAGAMIVENLTNLESLPKEGLHVSLLPLSLTGCDGSPIRAIAWVPD